MLPDRSGFKQPETRFIFPGKVRKNKEPALSHTDSLTNDEGGQPQF